MLVRDTKGIYRHQVKEAVGKDATAEQVLDYLFGDCMGESKSDFTIRIWDHDNKTPLQRLNFYWLVPFTLICAPVRYVFYGYIGWDTKTKFGRWILKIAGEYR